MILFSQAPIRAYLAVLAAGMVGLGLMAIVGGGEGLVADERVTTIKLPGPAEPKKAQALTITMAEARPAPLNRSRGQLHIAGAFNVGKEEAHKVTVSVEVLHPRAGLIERGTATVEPETKQSGAFNIVLGGFDYSRGGYAVKVSLRVLEKEIEIRTLNAPAKNPAEGNVGKPPKHGEMASDSRIKFATGSPTGGKNRIDGGGTYDPGKITAGNDCSITMINLKARNLTTGLLLMNSSIPHKGAWSSVLGGVPAGDYHVWAEFIVDTAFTGYTSSATDFVKVTVTN